MKPKEDIYYIEKIKTGDGSAYAGLVDKYKDYVFNIAFRILQNREDAEEIAQDVFIKAYRKIEKFKGDSKFSTWLYRIAFNTAVSKTRKKKPETMEINEEITGAPFSQVENQLEKIGSSERKKYLEKGLDKLENDDRLILTLYYLNEEKTGDIAEITGWSKSNVKVKLLRARKKLYHELQLLLKNEFKTLMR